jgi:hypothetical protein
MGAIVVNKTNALRDTIVFIGDDQFALVLYIE